MAQADTGTGDQCKALTESGERCSRPAQDDGFCYQHDEGDPTVDEDDGSADDDTDGSADDDTDGSTTDGADERAGEERTDDEDETDGDDASDATDETTAMSETETETTDPGDVDADVDVDDAPGGIESVLEIRRSVESTAGELIGRELDGVNEISATEDGWRGVVEVVERSAIPDTQDILGRYEIELTEDGTVEGYRRIDRYRRDDTSDRQ